MVAKLFIAGDQVPDTPLVDVVGKEKDPFSQIGAICVKLGVMGTLKLTIDAGDVPEQP